MERNIQEHSLYRSYEGNYYYTVGLAMDKKTEKMMVVYHALYGDNEMYVETLESFISEVEKNIKNKTNQKYKFELAQEE